MLTLIAPEHSFEIAIYCHECGKELLAHVHKNGNEQWISVEPCEICTLNQDGLKQDENA